MKRDAAAASWRIPRGGRYRTQDWSPPQRGGPLPFIQAGGFRPWQAGRRKSPSPHPRPAGSRSANAATAPQLVELVNNPDARLQPVFSRRRRRCVCTVLRGAERAARACGHHAGLQRLRQHRLCFGEPEQFAQCPVAARFRASGSRTLNVATACGDAARSPAPSAGVPTPGKAARTRIARR